MVLRTRCERRSVGHPPRSMDVNEVIDRPETVLEMARRHVLEGEERLVRQIAIDGSKIGR